MAEGMTELLATASPTGLAVGGAILAAAIGFTAVKAFGGSGKPSKKGGKSSSTGSSSGNKKKPKKKSSKKARGSETESVNASELSSRDEPPTSTSEINLDDFVGDFPDTEEEDEKRAEKKRLRRKQRKKAKGKATSSATSDSDAAAVRAERAKAAKKDAEEGWETVTYRKKGSKAKLDANN